MAKYSVRFTEGFYRSLAPIPKKDVKLILRRTMSLADDPSPPGSQKLVGDESYRIRQGNYRILYYIEDAQLVVVAVKVGHRREVYDR